MKNKHILKVLSLLAAVCIAAGCRGSTTVETTTAVTTTTAAQITTTMATAEVTEETTTAETEEADGIKYCEIPEGMTFEDLCGLFYYKDAQIRFPCTLNEFLALDKEFVAGEYEEAKSFTCIYKYDNNGVVLDFVGMSTIGDLNSYEDISKYFIFNTSCNPPSYSLYYDVLSFNGLYFGDDFHEIRELLGEPSYEQVGYCNYYFTQDKKIIYFEFTYTSDYKFKNACFGYEEE